MARAIHEVAAKGLLPLGIKPACFPLLVELWFGEGATRASLAVAQEADLATTDSLLRQMAEDGLIVEFPGTTDAPLALTTRAQAVRDEAVAAARGANQVAASALSEAEQAAFVDMMNRVIDALQAARAH